MTLQKTIQQVPLHSLHIEKKAKMVNFSGWEMPLQYSSIIDEHNAVRNKVGIFDVSHMGEFIFMGENAFEFVNSLITNDLNKLRLGQALYSGMLYENATFVDDVIVYLLEKDKILMVVNAGNRTKNIDWIKERLYFSEYKKKVIFTDVSEEYCLLAIQGKKSREVIRKMFPNLKNISPFSFEFYFYSKEKSSQKDNQIIIANTGYTGEDGIEIFASPQVAEDIFIDALSNGVITCGLAARDSLRLEKGYALYGHEISDKLNPLEAGLMWTVSKSKDFFIGKPELEKIIKKGVKKKLVGLILEKGIARDGDVFFDENEVQIGKVTSGTFSPTLKKGIALAYLNKNFLGKEVFFEIRGKKIIANVVKKIFV